MAARRADAQKQLTFPWCVHCSRGLTLAVTEKKWNVCDACDWKEYVTWCAQCEAWRHLRGAEDANQLACPSCRALVQQERHFCQSCEDPKTLCKCPKEDTKEKAVKACCSFCRKPCTAHRGGTAEVPYCSDECRYPKCNGFAPNGKACQKERTSSRAYNGNKPRWDQQNEWYCHRCRDISQPASPASPAKKQKTPTVEEGSLETRNCHEGESVESRNCHLCKKSWLASDTEQQGTQYYCRTCLDEEFTCGGPKGCGDNYKRRDGQFDWSHLKEFKNQNKKRKSVLCKKCRDSKAA